MCRSTCLFSCVIIIALVLQVDADSVTIDGDTRILLDTEVTYHLTLHHSIPYPPIFFFGYEFVIDFPKPLKVELLSNTYAKFKHHFANVPPKPYTMTVQVYVYFMQQKGWKVAENSLTIDVKDNLNDFFKLQGQQDGLQPYTPEFTYMPNSPVLFLPAQEVPNAALRDKSTTFDYRWTLSGPNATQITENHEKFINNFTLFGEYNLKLDITANLTVYSIVKKGTLSKTLQIKSPISNVSITGNNFVQNGSLLHMNISCNGSSNFMICYYFSSSPSNKTCFESGLVLNECFLPISHYFSQNGTHYVNIGVQNDVSQMMNSTKITIYKVGPKQSLVFVILPLVSSFLVIIIILFGVAHHIKQRRRLNATIEVATIENFGLYQHNDSPNEMTFFERIQDSCKSLFCRNS